MLSCHLGLNHNTLQNTKSLSSPTYMLHHHLKSSQLGFLGDQSENFLFPVSNHFKPMQVLLSGIYPKQLAFVKSKFGILFMSTVIINGRNSSD